MRSAYAIEYDCIYPTRLKASLESKDIKGLFFGGQINGTSGYEEAAAQGLIAGVNAVRCIEGKEPVILDRSQAYIGVLIDDIITKGTEEPYRMMTSRSEYRLLLRQDNADLRLTPIGHEIGLISDERYTAFLHKKAAVEQEKERLTRLIIKPGEHTNKVLEGIGSSPIKSGVTLAELIRRPEVGYANTAALDPERPVLSDAVCEQVEVQIKYDGYIKKQVAQVEQFKKMEKKLIPENIDYTAIGGLRLEAVEKLTDIQPKSMGQASRISGVSPADLSVLLIYLEQNRRQAPVEEEENE